MGFGDCRSPDSREPRRHLRTRQGTAHCRPQTTDGNRGQRQSTFGVRGNHSQEVEILELRAHCFFVRKNGRPRGQAFSLDRPSSCRAEKTNFNAGAESLAQIDRFAARDAAEVASDPDLLHHAGENFATDISNVYEPEAAAALRVPALSRKSIARDVWIYWYASTLGAAIAQAQRAFLWRRG